MAGGPDGSGGPHVFVDDVDRPVLAGDDHHHLSRVLRLRPGDPCTVGDGAGAWRPVRFGDPVEVAGPVEHVPAPAPALTVAFALVKGERPEWAVQKLTELGVDVIVPFAAERSVVRWDERKRAQAVERLRRVAREASMQCRRCWLPDVRPVASFAAVSALPGAVLADRGGRRLRRTDTVVLVGPEGGWAPDESACGLDAVVLGAHVLRAESATVAAGALLAALREGFVSEG